MRLDKYLTEMGMGSRSEVKQGIRKGFAKVNDAAVTRPEYKVTDKDKVFWKGTPVDFVEYEYIMLNKPAGVVSATEDSRERTVVDLIKNSRRKDLFPVGRLDKDTEGLLLLIPAVVSLLYKEKTGVYFLVVADWEGKSRRTNRSTGRKAL